MSSPSTCRLRLEPFIDAISIEMAKIGDLTLRRRTIGLQVPGKETEVLEVDAALDRALEEALRHWVETKEWGSLPAIGVAAGALYVRGKKK